MFTFARKPSLPDNSLISLASNGAPGYTITGKSLLKNILLNPSKTRVELIKTLPKLQGLLRPSTYGNTVLAMLGSRHSGAMNFEEFNAFCHGRIVSQNLATADINREEIHHHHDKDKAKGGKKVVRDILFSAHVDNARKEEQKFVRNTKEQNRLRLKQARQERELREKAVKEALKEKDEQEQVKEGKARRHGKGRCRAQEKQAFACNFA